MLKKDEGSSVRVISLMIALGKFLQSKNIAHISQLFEKLTFSKQGWLSLNEFQKLAGYCSIFCSQQFSAMDIVEMYKELCDGWEQITQKHFVKVYDDVCSKFPPSSRPPDTPKTVPKTLPSIKNALTSDQERTRVKGLVKAGERKILTYFDSHDAEAVFQEFDEESSGSLGVLEFNKFLISTDIREFESREVRKYLINKLYTTFPNKKMDRKVFMHLFVNKDSQRKLKNPEVDFFRPEGTLKSPNLNSNKNPTLNLKKNNDQIKPSVEKQKKNVTIAQKPFEKPNAFKKPEKASDRSLNEIDLKMNMNKKESSTSSESFSQGSLLENLDVISKSFPEAMRYFKNGIPSENELQYLEKLENLLNLKRTYADQQPPYTAKGEYTSASQIFKGEKYQLFQMAQSVIHRQKSRIGIARQMEPKDIIQGEVGDCYFLSSIASLISIHPEVISERFLFRENPANYYVTMFFIDGKWVYVETDDCFPTRNSRPIFAKPHGNEVWVMLLEKCWAKLFGSYEAISSGSASEAFAALSGAPTEYFTCKEFSEKEVIKKLKGAYENQFVITASGSKFLESLSEKESESIGLVSGHAYSFLKLFELKETTLIKVRNPWGSREWQGEWSFKSAKWTPELRNRLNYNRHPEDGSFYMSSKDFLKYFGSFNICQINPYYVHTPSLHSFHQHKSQYLKVTVSEGGQYSLSLYQENKRKLKAKYTNHQYSSSRIFLMRLGAKGDMEYIASAQQKQSESCSVTAHLLPGSYLVSAKISWSYDKVHEACLTAYGPEKLTFETVDRSIAPVFKRELLESYSNKNRGQKKTYDKYGAFGAFNETSFSIDTGIGYYRIENPSDKKLTIKVEFNIQRGMKVVKPDKLPFVFELLPGTKFLKGFFISPAGFKYSSSESISYTR